MSIVRSAPSLRLVTDATKGRSLVIASPDGVPAGAVLFSEKAYAGIVLSEFKGTICNVCYKAADPDICCDDCSEVTYCSDECQSLLQHVHDLECPVLEDIDVMVKKSGTDRDLLRLLLRMLCTRASEAGATTSSHVVVSTFDHVREMVHATHLLGDAWNASVASGAAMLLTALPSSVTASLTVHDVVELAGRVNENSYSVDSWTGQPMVTAVCMFPLAGLVNHACDPNCTWSNAGDSTIAVKATRFIPCGEEITLTYIDTNRSRDVRQRDLAATKHFDCRCARCTEPLATSVDLRVDGVCCASCGVDGLFVGSLDDQTTPWACKGCSRPVSADAIEQFKVEAASLLARADAAYAKRQYKETTDLLDDLRDHYDVHSTNASDLFLHPSHYILTKALRVLADCNTKIGNIETAYANRKEVIARLTAVVPRYSFLMGNCYFDLGDILTICLKHDVWKDDVEVAAKRAEADAAFATCVDIRTICFVEEHPLVVEARKRLA
ncbi:hypothetical protein SPRG_20376 [Saprolegnia parasitica CBS 223.65]|uniref:SET domain-containing protein n=1 Tax=Saprolegnia parasitica (strain CBS 223.65) TaxID=695850 RepID=A0A067CB88_SAPPC|nr:hypothetical protein SPRG_20376 [Saprolegnia parasitica CBS 223.65]KDO27733.1 hypothetical protein SPRG_20376 [Saprolegnia parasitica CBS 223.65]|eukprot:XP_012201606.1 hypothetical protein SPRG_20376 [Saprolegnia parasitica CBS 223.65]